MVAGLDQVRAELVVCRPERSEGPAVRSNNRAFAALRMTAVVVLLVACDRPSSDVGGGRSTLSAADSALRATPGYIVDSLHPPVEAVRRFRAGLDSVSTLDGSRTRDALITHFMAAVRVADGVALQRLTITRAEYAFLAYPELPVSRPPYRQPPEIAWLLLWNANVSAINKLARTAAARFELLGYACSSGAERWGTLRLERGCTVSVREGGTEKRMRLFGTIVERDGRWKFLSLEGDL